MNTDSIINSGPSDVLWPDNLRLYPARRPLADDADFREAMAAMAASVGVITARFDGEQLGRTVTAAMSLSVRPPALVVSIDITSRIADLIAKAAGFSFAVLANEQETVADAFAGQVEAERRFEYGAWDRWPSGHPKLLGALTAFDCELIGAISTATHVLFVGGVAEVDRGGGRMPLVRQDRQCKRLANHDYATQGER